jgi:hypothetical protein
MLHKYYVIYSVWYYPWFHVTVVGLGYITHRYGGTPVHKPVLPDSVLNSLENSVYLPCYIKLQVLNHTAHKFLQGHHAVVLYLLNYYLKIDTFFK